MTALIDMVERKPVIRAGAVQTLPSGEVIISKRQRDVHVFFEALAVFVAAPVCVAIAYRNPLLPSWQKGFLYTMAGVTLAVDGGLLLSYAREKNK